jgi:hypothetical protein
MAATLGRISDRTDDAADEADGVGEVGGVGQSAGRKAVRPGGGVADAANVRGAAAGAAGLGTRAADSAYRRNLEQAKSEDRWRDDGGPG